MAVDRQGSLWGNQRLRMGVFALCNVGFLVLALPAVLEPMTFWTGIVLGDYAYPTHELHHIVMASVFGVLLLGVIAQAMRPSQRVGALHSSVLLWLSLTLVFAGTGDFSSMHLVLLGLLLGAVVSHPAGATQIPQTTNLERSMLVVGVLTALGGIALAGTELATHVSVADEHAGFGHYQFMAVTGLGIAALSLYGCLRGIGWRFAVYGSAALLAVFGLTSILYPGAEQGSSLGVGLGGAAVLWAIVFVSVSERTAPGGSP